MVDGIVPVEPETILSPNDAAELIIDLSILVATMKYIAFLYTSDYEYIGSLCIIVI